MYVDDRARPDVHARADCQVSPAIEQHIPAQCRVRADRHGAGPMGEKGDAPTNTNASPQPETWSHNGAIPYGSYSLEQDHSRPAPA